MDIEKLMAYFEQEEKLTEMDARRVDHFVEILGFYFFTMNDIKTWVNKGLKYDREKHDGWLNELIEIANQIPTSR